MSGAAPVRVLDDRPSWPEGIAPDLAEAGFAVLRVPRGPQGAAR
ncbi:MAG TPA: hypothetical protein VMU51_25705 [Mycobacteriales bacterium]|nr:hypothetical protein [Mycobacteriales bacterium]